MQIIRKEKPNNKRFNDLEGMLFGRWKVEKYLGTDIKNKHQYWLCRCSCPLKTIKEVCSTNLTSLKSLSCGCHRTEIHTIHGMSESEEYVIYKQIRQRCTNLNNNYYHNYGDRGIEFRFANFEEFYAEVGVRPSKNHSIDRINNNGHYQIGNIKWSTRSEQMRNTRVNHWITINNIKKLLIEWTEIYKIKQSTILSRIAMGWCEPCSVKLPANPIGKKLYTCEHKY